MTAKRRTSQVRKTSTVRKPSTKSKKTSAGEASASGLDPRLATSKASAKGAETKASAKGAGTSLPMKLRRVLREDFLKLDRTGGGAISLAPLSDEAIVIGFAHLLSSWDLREAKEIHNLSVHGDAVAVHRASKRVVSVGFRRLFLLNAAKGNVVTTWGAHGGGIGGCDIDPRGTLAVSCGQFGEVFLWDIEKRTNLPTGKPRGLGDLPEDAKPIASFVGHQDVVGFCKFSPDGTRLLTGSMDKTARLWDVASHTEMARFDAPANVSCGQFSADGKHAVIGVESGDVVVLDMEASVVARWRAHARELRGLAIVSPQRLVTAASGELRLWDFEKRKALAIEKVGRSQIRALMVHGNSVITTGPLALWDLV